LLNGSIDRLVLVRQSGRLTAAEVIDFKTDTVTNPTQLLELTEFYRPQLEAYKEAAERITGLPAERITVTGAYPFDLWFDRKPSRSRASFCERVGLRSDRPFILYLCSSLFRGTASEAEFVEQWVEAVRSSTDPRLKDIGILIRPHPARLDEWKNVDLSGYRNLTFWGAHPVNLEAKDDYFDSMYYSAAVVGIIVPKSLALSHDRRPTSINRSRSSARAGRMVRSGIVIGCRPAAGFPRSRARNWVPGMGLKT